MHPEVQEDAPGDCPDCGMALEPMGVAHPGGGDNAERKAMSRRFWACATFTLPLVSLVMLDMLPSRPISAMLPKGWRGWIELGLAVPVCTWGAWPFYRRGWQSIRRRSLNMFTLIALGVGVAFGYSVVAILYPEIFPLSHRDMHGMVPVYFESATVIVTLILLGQVLELRARDQTSQAIQGLLDLAPATARRVDAGGKESDIPLEKVLADDRLRVRPGEKVPVDGVVLDGESYVDESMFSGEATPVAKRIGHKLIGGSLNQRGSLLMRAQKVGSHTLLARIVALVAEAQRSRAPIQRLADKVAGVFVPIVIGVAVLTFLAWGLSGPEPRLSHALLNSIAVLIVACPCALGLATPMSIMVATGRGAQLGVLFRNAQVIETLRKIDTLVVDKTGTLTEGRPRIVAQHSEPPFTDAKILQLAASLEQASEHPIAACLTTAAQAEGLRLSPPSSFEALPGLGAHGSVENHRVVIGNRACMEKFSLAVSEKMVAQQDLWENAGHTVLYIAVDKTPVSSIAIADPIKDTTPRALRLLRRKRLRVIMLTGDHAKAAHHIADPLGIEEVIAGVMPDEKVATIKKLRDEGRTVAMAGDGINDAPALAAANVGIAMGTGSDIAIESADMTLVGGDLSGVWRAWQLSHTTLRNIRQNLFFAFVYNILGVPIAAGVLYPSFGIQLSPMLAAAAMSLSSVSVIANALRLRNVLNAS